LVAMLDCLAPQFARYSRHLLKVAQAFPYLPPDSRTRPPIHPLQRHMQYIGHTPTPEELAQLAMPPSPPEDPGLWERFKKWTGIETPTRREREIAAITPRITGPTYEPGQHFVEPPPQWAPADVQRFKQLLARRVGM